MSLREDECLNMWGYVKKVKMPRYCSVPKFTSNKHSQYETCFRFPKDEELKRKWIKAIHRDFIPNDECSLHKALKKKNQWFILTKLHLKMDTWTGCVPRITKKIPENDWWCISEDFPRAASVPVKSYSRKKCNNSTEQKNEKWKSKQIFSWR